MMTTIERILAIRQATKRILTKQQVRDLVISTFEATMKELHKGEHSNEPEVQEKLVPVHRKADLTKREDKGVRATKETRKQTIPTDKLDDNQQLEEIDTSAAQKEEDEIFQQMWANHRKVLTGELSAEDAVDPFKDLPSWKDGDDKENQDPNGMPPLEGTVMYL